MSIFFFCLALLFACYASWRVGVGVGCVEAANSTTSQRKKVNRWVWHIAATATTGQYGTVIDHVVVVRRGDPRYKNLDYTWQNAKTWRYDPTDPESYGSAIAEAEEYLTGLRNADRLARELSTHH